MTGRAERSELREALDVARRIEYPNLVWPAAHGLAVALASRAERERAARSKGDEVQTLAALAADTIRSIADRAPEAGLRESFLAWTPVQTALEDIERLRKF